MCWRNLFQLYLRLVGGTDVFRGGAGDRSSLVVGMVHKDMVSEGDRNPLDDLPRGEQSMIPKIFHQTTKTGQIEPKWAPLTERLLALHPNWEYRLWGDEENEILIRDRFPDFSDVYRNLPRPIMRADLARYAYMSEFGGVYLDTDYEFLRPFDLLEKEVVLPRSSPSDGPLILGNCVFGSRPGHPFWIALLEEIAKSDLTLNTQVTEEDVIRLTGPGLVSRVYMERFLDDSSLFVPPKSAFHPPIPMGSREYQNLLVEKAAYGIHFCYGSWRALSFRERLASRLK